MSYTTTHPSQIRTLTLGQVDDLAHGPTPSRNLANPGFRTSPEERKLYQRDRRCGGMSQKTEEMRDGEKKQQMSTTKGELQHSRTPNCSFRNPCMRKAYVHELTHFPLGLQH